MRRNWVSLDSRFTSCVVLDAQDGVKHALRSYELSSARKATAYDLKSRPPGSGPQWLETARRTRRILDGECCYAFYCKPTMTVKIGLTTNLLDRWARLETQGGRPLQLAAVWQGCDIRSHERALHDRFAAHRGLGEWFAADPVIEALREALRTGMSR